MVVYVVVCLNVVLVNVRLLSFALQLFGKMLEDPMFLIIAMISNFQKKGQKCMRRVDIVNYYMGRLIRS
jgi:hypothetical protein